MIRIHNGMNGVDKRISKMSMWKLRNFEIINNRINSILISSLAINENICEKFSVPQ